MIRPALVTFYSFFEQNRPQIPTVGVRSLHPPQLLLSLVCLSLSCPPSPPLPFFLHHYVAVDLRENCSHAISASEGIMMTTETCWDSSVILSFLLAFVSLLSSVNPLWSHMCMCISLLRITTPSRPQWRVQIKEGATAALTESTERGRLARKWRIGEG